MNDLKKIDFRNYLSFALNKFHSWGAKSQISTNFEICLSKFANFTNFESSYKFMYEKIEINNYTDMTKFEND